METIQSTLMRRPILAALLAALVIATAIAASIDDEILKDLEFFETIEIIEAEKMFEAVKKDVADPKSDNVPASQPAKGVDHEN